MERSQRRIGGSLSLLGFKMKETEKRRALQFFLASSSSSRTPSLRVWVFACSSFVGMMYSQVVS